MLLNQHVSEFIIYSIITFCASKCVYVSFLILVHAMCINCNKHFKSIRAVSMNLRIIGARHVVNIINHGYYDTVKTFEHQEIMLIHRAAKTWCELSASSIPHRHTHRRTILPNPRPHYSYSQRKCK